MASLNAVDCDRLKRFRITKELIELHRLWRGTNNEIRSECGIQYKGDLSGVVWPIWGADDLVKGYRVRRDNPEIESGKPIAKYVQSADRPHLFFERSSRPHIYDVIVPAIFVESYSSCLALASWCLRSGRSLLIVATSGCWGWRGTIGKLENENGVRVDEKGPLPDLDLIQWTDRKVIICFDSNVVTNKRVQEAERAFCRELNRRGAAVYTARIPEGAGINGPDDYLGAHSDAEFQEILDSAPINAVTVNEAQLQAIARLSRIQYDQCREAEAERLGIRVTTLDEEIKSRRPKQQSVNGAQLLLLTDPEPWPEHVDLSALLSTIQAVIKRFVVVSDAAAITMALWVLHTYVHDAANVSPILAIVSPEKRCGKTTLLELLITLVLRALPTSNATSSTIFRAVEAYRPTLLIDEADTFINGDTDELRGILNSGHRRSTSIVLRTVGDGHEVQTFSTWCAKVIASIGKLPDTLQDRSIVVSMRRRSANESVERMRFDRIAAELEPVRRKAARWTADNLSVLKFAEPAMPPGIDDRASDNWRPLLAIADVAAGDWPTLARNAAAELCNAREVDEESARIAVLTDIRNLFESRGVEKLASVDMIEGLSELEERPWPEWKNGKPITPRQLAKLLKPFCISPRAFRLPSGITKGYELNQFDDAFSRYLPPVR